MVVGVRELRGQFFRLEDYGWMDAWDLFGWDSVFSECYLVVGSSLGEAQCGCIEVDRFAQ
jgi:hypothetical protein